MTSHKVVHVIRSHFLTNDIIALYYQVFEQGIVVHTCDTGSRETEAGLQV